MALTSQQLLDQTLDLRIGDIQVAKNGAKNAPVGAGADLQVIRLVLAKNPVLTTPFVPNAFDGGDRVSLDLRAEGEEHAARAGDAVDKIDAAILAAVTQNKESSLRRPRAMRNSRGSIRRSKSSRATPSTHVRFA